MQRTVILAVILAATLAAVVSTPIEAGQAAVLIRIAPPAPRLETRAVAPGPHHVWLGGHWSWNGRTHVWIAGSWKLPPSAHASWVAGRWSRRSKGWIWVPGRWRTT